MRYIVEVECVEFHSSASVYRAELFCNGQRLADGLGDSPILAASLAVDKAARLNAELEALASD